jgi:CBS domain-containing protein
MLTAADVMTGVVITVGPDTSVQEIAKLLHRHRISGVPVVGEDGQVLGIISEGDLIGHARVAGEQRRSRWHDFVTDPTILAQSYAKSHGRVARDVMTADVITVLETTSIAEVARTLERHQIKRAPVVRAGRLVGLVTRGNLLQVLATADVSRPMNIDDRIIRKQLNDELEAQPWAHLQAKNIVVENGVVHLFGLVQSNEERHAIRLAAENVAGVRVVEDHLTLAPVETYGFWAPA